MATSVSPSWVRGKVIGRGSYGLVFLGFYKEKDGGVFAVKSVDLNSHSDQISSLQNEIQILSSLDYSPYIVEYLGDDVDGSHRNLHLELLPGGTVTDAAASRRRRGGRKFADEGPVRSHARCLVSALSHLHSRGIVHCDVKGRNVIIGQDPSVAKLADFGSAIRAGNRSEPRGSPLWMAPEVVRGEYQGPESDVWALGCTVIEMVTGSPAWDEDKGAETLSRIGFSDDVPEFPPEMSAQGRDFLEKCLRRNPEERWSCDRLLRHPFVASETAAAEKVSESHSSPRCVLDWADLEFKQELETESEAETESISGEEVERCLRGRLGELCHGGVAAAEWESEDGWLVVREADSRINWEYAGYEEEEEEEEEMSAVMWRTWSESECGTSSGAEWEFDIGSPECLKTGSGGGEERVEGKWRRRWRQGSGDHLAVVDELEGQITISPPGDDVAAVVSGIYGLCNFLVFMQYFLLAMFRCHNFNYNNKQVVKHFGSY